MCKADFAVRPEGAGDGPAHGEESGECEDKEGDVGGWVAGEGCGGEFEEGGFEEGMEEGEEGEGGGVEDQSCLGGRGWLIWRGCG